MVSVLLSLRSVRHSGTSLLLVVDLETLLVRRFALGLGGIAQETDLERQGLGANSSSSYGSLVGVSQLLATEIASVVGDELVHGSFLGGQRNDEAIPVSAHTIFLPSAAIEIFSNQAHASLGRDFEVGNSCSSVADTAHVALATDANSLVLVGQVKAASVVEGLEGASVGSEKVLKAAIGGLVDVIARVLGHTDGPLTHGGSGVGQLEGQDVAFVRSINVHMISAIGSANHWGTPVAGAGHGELVILALSELGELLATSSGEDTSRGLAQGGSDGGRSSNDEGGEVQPQLADVVVALADLGVTSSGQALGAFEVGDVFGARLSAVHGECAADSIALSAATR